MENRLNYALADIHNISRGWKYYFCNQLKQYKIVTYVTKRENHVSVLDDIAVIDYDQFSKLYLDGVINKLILPRDRFITELSLVSELERKGVNRDDILLTERITVDDHKKKDIKQYDDSEYLPYLEFHVADHCNLNCKGCEHYSGLVKTPYFHNAETIEFNFRLLKKYILDIGCIRILGGEPLLNDELGDIIRITRSYYQEAIIRIVTNGVLVLKTDEDVLDACRETGAIIEVSLYPPLIGKEESIRHFLEKKGIRNQISYFRSEFEMKYTLDKQTDKNEIYKHCKQRQCVNLYEGKIATCFLPFTTKYFNEYFNLRMPDDGWIDLRDDSLTTRKLKQEIQKPIERCAYCKEKVNTVPWSVISNPSKLSEWIVGMTEEE